MAKKTEKREFVNPFSEAFTPIWELWKKYKAEEWQFTYKSTITEQMALNNLAELSGGDESMAIRIVKQSMGNKWKGLFELKTVKLTSNGQQQGNSSNSTREQLNKLNTERFGARR